MRQVVRAPTPVILAIDLEPEAILIERDGSSPWSGAREAFEFVNALREYARAASGNPAAVTWALRMDRQILESYGSEDYGVQLFGAQIAEAERRGDEVGLHTHFYRWDPTMRQWRTEHGEPDWVERCLRESFAAFAKVFMRPCSVYRGGERWHSDAAVRIVENLGVRFDLTLERGRSATPTIHPEIAHSGSLPDYMKVPLFPYRPSQSDFRDVSLARDRSIWMLPCAGGQLGHQPEWRQAWKRFLVDAIDPRRKFKALYVPYTCQLSFPASEFRAQIRAYLTEPGFSYVALPIRSSSFAHDDRKSNVVENLRFLIGELHARGFEFATPARAMELLGID